MGRCLRSMRKAVLPSCLWGVLAFAPLASAVTERVTDYQYDAAGNIVHIGTQQQSTPPQVGELNLGFVNLGRTQSFTMTGSALLGARISTTTPGLSVGNVDNSLAGVLQFNLSAALGAPIGPATLTLVTGLGSTTVTIQVAASLPRLLTRPSPIAIADGGATQTIELQFQAPRPVDETYQVSVRDPAVAIPGLAAVSIAAGETSVPLSLTGVALGSTVLDLVEPSRLFSFSFPVVVAEDFIAAGGEAVYSQAVGISVGGGSPLLAPLVGVVASDDTPLLAPLVGITTEDGSPIFAPPVGATLGPQLTELSPSAVTRDAIVSLHISGLDLAAVTAISAAPATGITFGPLDIDPAGTGFSVEVTISPTATTGERELLIESVDGPIRTRIGGNLRLSID